MATVFAAATGSAGIVPNEFTSIDRYKVAPLLFDDNYNKYEDWKHKFIAYMVLQHTNYSQLFKSSNATILIFIDVELQTSAQGIDEAKRWISISSNLHCILFNI